jgi:diguanylate cyclase (GGDEF)-like protein
MLLASMWLSALTVDGDETAAEPNDIPMDTSSARGFLTMQSAALMTILLDQPFRPLQAATVGEALVTADFISADVLGRSLRVLILRLPELIRGTAGGTAVAAAGVTGPELDRRVAEVTEALANGYVRALRDRTLAEQESIRRAELDAQRIVSEQLRHAATHDPLTGLPNRAAVFGRLAAAVSGSGDFPVGLCYLDLDGFKTINDRYGHEAGDELLVQVAGRIGEVSRARGALAARIGGDEFVVLAERSHGIAWLTTLAAEILAMVSRPVPLRIGRVCVSACAGIVECAPGTPAAQTMVADADAALYLAKSRGPGCCAVHDQVTQGSRLACRPSDPVRQPARRELRGSYRELRGGEHEQHHREEQRDGGQHHACRVQPDHRGDVPRRDADSVHADRDRELRDGQLRTAAPARLPPQTAEHRTALPPRQARDQVHGDTAATPFRDAVQTW